MRGAWVVKWLKCVQNKGSMPGLNPARDLFFRTFPLSLIKVKNNINHLYLSLRKLKVNDIYSCLYLHSNKKRLNTYR